MLFTDLLDHLSGLIEQRLSGYDLTIAPPIIPDQEVLAAAETAAQKILAGVAGSDLEPWVTQYLKIQRLRICRDFMVLKEVAKGRKVLEYAASPYLLSLMLSGYADSYVCTDLEPSRLPIRDVLDVVRLDIEAPGWSVPQHDLAIFHETFEHLRINPVATLETIYRSLDEGGILSISTPNLMSPNLIRSFLNAGSFGPDPYVEFKKLERLGHCGHIREYSLVEICDLLVKVGFKKLEVRYVGTPQNYRSINGRGKYLPHMTHILATKTRGRVRAKPSQS